MHPNGGGFTYDYYGRRPDWKLEKQTLKKVAQ
jgi:hypothetical protein